MLIDYRLSVHAVLHLADDLVELGSIRELWTATMEREIGHSKRRIRQFQHPFTVVSNEIIRREVCSVLQFREGRTQPSTIRQEYEGHSSLNLRSIPIYMSDNEEAALADLYQQAPALGRVLQRYSSMDLAGQEWRAHSRLGEKEGYSRQARFVEASMLDDEGLEATQYLEICYFLKLETDQPLQPAFLAFCIQPEEVAKVSGCTSCVWRTTPDIMVNVRDITHLLGQYDPGTREGMTYVFRKFM